MTRVLRKWHAWCERRRMKARRVAWAEAQHGAALGRKALMAWRRAVAVRHWKAAAAQRGAAFRRRYAARAALRRWRDAAASYRTARDAASAALAAAAAGMYTQKAAAAFVEWQAYAAERRRRRQRERYGMAYMRRWWQLVVIWGWRQRVARSRHLKTCGRVMQRVGRRLRLHLSWYRWWLAVEVLQGQRNTELRAVVLVRACWVTWRAMVEHWAVKRELLRAKAAAWGRAAAWQRRRALARLLRFWSCEAARRAAKAVAVCVAEGHWRRKALRGVVRAWRRYAWRQVMKHVVPEHRPHRLLRVALGGWLSHTRYKARKELGRRRAVRHRYPWGGWGFGGRDWADLSRLHSLHVARRVLHVWRHDFLPVAAAKRAAGRWADAQRRTSLSRRALAGWRLEATRLAAKRDRQREAAGFAALQLLRRVLVAWSTAPHLQETRRAAKAVRLEELVSELAAGTTRRLLAAWRQVAEDLVMKRFQDTRARASWRHCTLRRCMTSWALYLAHRRTATCLTARARTAYRHRVWRSVLEALARYAATRRAKRRAAAVASEHQRRLLLRRGMAALTWYGRYRAAKAREYIAARAQYVRRLQREGVAAWLQVGLELRQQRIEMLAARQARSLAQQLARVEPFARRWLNLVRHRRRQQQQLRFQTLPLEVNLTYPFSRPRGAAAAPAAASELAAAPAAPTASTGPRSLSAWPTTRTSAAAAYPVSASAVAAAAATGVRLVDAGTSIVAGGDSGGRLRHVAAAAVATTGMQQMRGRHTLATPAAATAFTTATTATSIMADGGRVGGTETGDFLLLPRRPATVACFGGAGGGGGQPADGSVRGLYDRPASLAVAGCGGPEQLPTAKAGAVTWSRVRPGTAHLVSDAAMAVGTTSTATTSVACAAAGIGTDSPGGGAGEAAAPSDMEDVEEAEEEEEEEAGAVALAMVAAAALLAGGRNVALHAEEHGGPRGGGGGGGGGGDGSGGDGQHGAAAIAAAPPSSAASAGITIHRPGRHPPDVLRLPSRGEGGVWAEEVEEEVHCGAGDGGYERRDYVLRVGVGEGDGGGGGFGRGGAASDDPNNLYQHERHRYHHQQNHQLNQTHSHQLRQPQQDGDGAERGVSSDPPGDEGELRELESVLRHCKRLKALLQELESADAVDGRPPVEDGVGGAATVTAAVDVAAAHAVAGPAEMAVVVRQQQAAQVRAALAALRPVVEDAAARLSKIRRLATEGSSL
ncbi:hypothetical protein VOLCADRAFT_91684 [Volvox carteri f. nagariensis]|uniref:Sfi1 spindle body domain-containing protein n=1 Tax=Volvox carteri f. nagariensis TaxID=3068 RepID=D8TXQ6_VOLCA|nr:uncharacterized protein VOLCADRAFT_91684 [Volvox carteri f. nagariensis]EFJ47681.1 hypothetical protein VOLCADRAFT_91684 [Volvox carteri f. nagariensis]|eukprot:XP_002951152.1 hypothetical protein VOLCADRAFT_91684 [Volvox carteri f. nagariensis]